MTWHDLYRRYRLGLVPFPPIGGGDNGGGDNGGGDNGGGDRGSQDDKEERDPEKDLARRDDLGLGLDDFGARGRGMEGSDLTGSGAGPGTTSADTAPAPDATASNAPGPGGGFLREGVTNPEPIGGRLGVLDPRSIRETIQDTTNEANIRYGGPASDPNYAATGGYTYPDAASVPGLGKYLQQAIDFLSPGGRALGGWLDRTLGPLSENALDLRDVDTTHGERIGRDTDVPMAAGTSSDAPSSTPSTPPGPPSSPDPLEAVARQVGFGAPGGGGSQPGAPWTAGDGSGWSAGSAWSGGPSGSGSSIIDRLLQQSGADVGFLDAPPFTTTEEQAMKETAASHIRTNYDTARRQLIDQLGARQGFSGVLADELAKLDTAEATDLSNIDRQILTTASGEMRSRRGEARQILTGLEQLDRTRQAQALGIETTLDALSRQRALDLADLATGAAPSTGEIANIASSLLNYGANQQFSAQQSLAQQNAGLSRLAAYLAAQQGQGGMSPMAQVAQDTGAMALLPDANTGVIFPGLPVPGAEVVP